MNTIICIYNTIYKLFYKIYKINFLSIILICNAIIKNDFSKYPIYLQRFERKIANFFLSKYCLTFSSGTTAFYAAILSLGLKPKSNILISRFTFPSILSVLKKFDFKYYFYDLDYNFQPDKKSLNKIKNKNFDLIITTHPFGFFSDFNILKKFKNKKCKIIFDCSHSHGLKYNNKYINNFCDIGFFSMQGNKAISSGEGGFILTNNKKYYQKMIQSHHPGHPQSLNEKKLTSFIFDIKLRMHPLAALIAEKNLKLLNKNNIKNMNKIREVYKILKRNKEIIIPDQNIINTAGYHYGIPFFVKKKIYKINPPFLNFNWIFCLFKNNKIYFDKNKKFYNFNLLFVDLEWVKNNSLTYVKYHLKKKLSKHDI
jgi:dTDP-4-amino-4,6-dideoxygalactose transaminase